MSDVKKRVRKRRTASERQLAKIEEEFLDRQRVMSAAANMERLFAEGDGRLPSMVDTLWAMFNDPDTPARDRLAIAKQFGNFIAMKEQALSDRGLLKVGPKKVENHAHLNQYNLTLDDLDRLPEDLRERMILDHLQESKVG